MGCKKGEEAHHVIPLELKDHPVAKLAQSSHWNFNGAGNGVCLDTSVHHGSHPKYTAGVRSYLERLIGDYGNDWGKMRAKFLAYISQKKTNLKNRTDKLD
jgi:hypothetical protein